MTDFFTSEHFKLLNKWKGQKRDNSIPEQNRAYDELSRAYEYTEAWANQLCQVYFPKGKVEVRKRPTNQGNNFASYNWAKIYPSKDSPKELAYTVGIDAEAGFVVKIDTVNLDDTAPARRKYLALRGSFNNQSPIARILPASDGLSKSLSELVEWSISAIKSFSMKYEDVVTQLDLNVEISDDELLARFDSKPAFKNFRQTWSAQDQTIFCRLARAVHMAGLDWWHVGIGFQVRFGRKQPNSERAIAVLGVVRGKQPRKISWTRAIGGQEKLNRVALTDTLVEQLSEALAAGREDLSNWLASNQQRPGFWPDELAEEPPENDSDDDEDGDLVMDETANKPFNRIYYGPPGTGKTYTLQQLLHNDYTSKAAVKDEGLWLQQQFMKLTWFDVIALVMLDLNRPAKVADVVGHRFYQLKAASAERKDNLTQNAWYYLQRHTPLSSTTVNQSVRGEPAIFDKSSKSDWFLIEGAEPQLTEYKELLARLNAGPTVAEEIKRYRFVTFHQSYGYEEFIEGLRPVLDGDESSTNIKYEIKDGVFTELCREARLEPTKRFAMVIDEINRGNISKIFGELITLIELDKREGMQNALPVSLAYSGKAFWVPANVDIIGTMNTADRSLALIDTALRRRFDFVPVMPDSRDVEGAPLFGLRVSKDDYQIDIPSMLSAINQRIEALYDRDHCIGHAYFTSLKGLDDGPARFAELTHVFRNRILPLLEEYFFEDWQKIRLVLADNQKTDPSTCFVLQNEDIEEGLARLFGKQDSLDSYTAKLSFELQDAAFDNPAAYIGIYDTFKF